MPLSTTDVLALCWFFALVLAYEIITTHSRFATRSLSARVGHHRRQWLSHMVEREQRHFDAILLASLSQSNAFFASTSVLGIGGLAAVMGSGEAAHRMLEQLPYVTQTTPALWEIKILFLIAILIYAFFKFAWAFRLSHYTAILFGATPPADGEANALERRNHAHHAARLLDLVGHHANSGLRSFYYAFGAVAWLFDPWLFILAMTLVFAILMRREFVSNAALIITAASAPAPRHEAGEQ